MHLNLVDRQLSALRQELDRIDHTGQSQSAIIARIRRLEDYRQGLVSGMQLLSTAHGRQVCEKRVKAPVPSDPHERTVHELGGKLVRVALDRKGHQRDVAVRATYAPGCGDATHVEGTNGGTMPCGALLGGKPYFCGRCKPAKVVDELLK